MPVLTHSHDSCTCTAASAFQGLVESATGSVPTDIVRTPQRNLARTAIAEQILVGRVRTMDPSQPEAEAIAIADGSIIGVGSADDLDGVRGPATRMVELGDGVAYPGFVEPHMHYWASAMMLDWADCSTRDQSFDDVVNTLRAARPFEGGWTLGASFDPSLVPGERTLHRDVLDAAIPDRPVAVLNASMHYIYANSKALELAGIHDDTPDPPGGFFEREDGRLTGALGEMGAMGKVMKILPRLSQAALADSLLRISQRAAAHGIVRTHDAATGLIFGTKEPGVFAALADRFATRVSYAIHDAVIDRLIDEGMAPGVGDDKVRATSIKMIGDGSNQGRSGYQFDNYLGRDFRGHPNHSLDHLTERIAHGHSGGWQMMIHANGDAMIGEALAAFRAALGDDSGLSRRHRIEHCSFATGDQLAEMGELGISPSFLMNHVYYWGRAFADNIVGPDKAGRLDPVATANLHGLNPTFHSDYTVTDFGPLRAVQTAVTRQVRDGGAVLNAQECADRTQALRAVTINAAWQVFADDVGGTLAPGKFADIVVLDDDPAVVDPAAIADIGIRQTLLGGELTFEA